MIQPGLSVSLAEGRYDRQERISWWDQGILAASRVLVVGAGALGNEVCKGLALVGVGRIDVVDMDSVEHSNLARCVLFRDGDEGKNKAEVVALAAAQLNPDVGVIPHVMRVERLGLAALADADVIVAGLDNREARAWVNQAARKVGRWWVDGAIEGIQGVARAFGPDGPCYECTLSETDRRIMAFRKSCALLSPEQLQTGFVPTNATTASVIAGVQVQEAIKLLHGRIDLLSIAARGWTFIGETLETFISAYGMDDNCPAHDRYEKLQHRVVQKGETFGDLVDGLAEVIELEEDIVLRAFCDQCTTETPVGLVVSACDRSILQCEECGGARRLDARSRFTSEDAAAGIRVHEAGLPERDVVSLRAPDGSVKRLALEMAE